MLPVLRPGDGVLIDPDAYRHHSPGPGDIVITRHPLRSDVQLIKRVIAVLDDGRLQLGGDNSSESTDSRSFGLVSPEHLRGRVTSRFSRKDMGKS
jgi:nickel-type superoxide dismutase maturation protease